MTAKKKRKVSYKELSEVYCIDCKKPLKVNIVNRNPLATRCYVCHNVAKGKFEMYFHRMDRKTKQIKIKVINFKEKQKRQKKIYNKRKR